MKLLLVLGCLILFCLVFDSPVGGPEYHEVRNFIMNDTTNQGEYIPGYSCGYFALDLATNASKHNISVQLLEVSYNPTFEPNSHGMVCFEADGRTWVVEPQDDKIVALSKIEYPYYRMYDVDPEGLADWNSRIDVVAPNVIDKAKSQIASKVVK